MNCPKCGKPMTKYCEKGGGNGPNGGTLSVVEETSNATNGYDFDIEMWKCLACKLNAYITNDL